MQIDRVVFDLDNTLLDTDSQCYYSMFQELADLLVQKKIINENPDKLFIKIVSLFHLVGKEMLLPAVFESYGEKLKDKTKKELVTFMDGYRPKELYLFPGAWTVLQQLSTLYELYLLTEGETSFQEWKIEKLNIRNFFKKIFIVSRDEKRTVLKDFDNPSSVAVIGDKIDGELLIARELNMIPILFSQGRHQSKLGENWYYRVKSTTQLPELLEQLRRSV